MNSFSRYFKRTPFSEIAKNLVVVLLVIFALSIIYDNVITPLLNKNINENFAVSDIPFDTMDESTDSNAIDGSHIVQRVKTSQLFWNENLRRDPFLSVILNKDIVLTDTLTAKVDSHQGTKKTLVQLGTKPRLTGIIKGIDSNFAIVDGQIMVVGDSIRGFRLESIQRQSVIFKKRSSTITINLDDGGNNA